MKQILYLAILFFLFETESFGLARPLSDPGSVNPVINSKTILYVLIPGKDSVLFSVTNVSVSGWKITKSPAQGTDTLVGADSRQVWVKYP